jgi:hypothetical protein
MTRVTIFTSTIGHGPARIAIAIHQDAIAESAFTIDLDNDNWFLTLKDAERLAAAGRRIEGALDYCAQRNEPVNLEPYFQRQLGFADGSSSKFELGLDEINGLACAYLEWKGKRAVDPTGRLLRALSILSEATRTIRQAEAPGRIQDIRIDARNYKSQFGWDGKAPWEQ